MSGKAFQGATVNGSGTLAATAKAHGTSPLDTTKASCDTHTVVGPRDLTVKAAIAMGQLRRNGTVLEELLPAQPASRVG